MRVVKKGITEDKDRKIEKDKGEGRKEKGERRETNQKYLHI